MNKTLKNALLMGTVIVAGNAFFGVAHADPDADMSAAIETSTTITAVAGDVMDFGSWLIGVPTAAPDSTIVMDPEDGSVAGTAGTGVQLIQLAGATAFGTVTVSLPSGADGLTLMMSHGTLPDTLGTGLTLSDISYYNPDTPAQTGVMVPATQYPITIADGATGAEVQFGGTITATATPDDGDHGEVFNVAFAY